MYQFSSYRWWSLLALFHKKLGMGEEGGLTISSVTTDQGYIREVTAVSEPLQSLPPITFTSLSSVAHPQSFPPKTQTTSLSTKSFTNLNPPLLIVTGVVLLLSFLVGKNLKWIEKNSQKQPSNIYWMIIIVNHLLIWLFSRPSSGCHLVESAANGEYYFVSLLKLAIFRDQGHIREVVAVRDASHRNLSTIPIPPPRQAFMLSTKFFTRPPPCPYTCSSIWPS